jgi:hypothetical protein
LGIAIAFVIAGFLFYWLLRSSERVEGRMVVETRKKEEVKKLKEPPKKLEKSEKK